MRRERQARRLKCGFVLGAFPSPDQLKRAKLIAIERFIHDMEKQGWTWAGGKFHSSGPVPNIEPTGELVDRYPLAESEEWLYFISGVFTKELPVGFEILVPNPSGHDPEDTDPIPYPKAVLAGVK